MELVVAPHSVNVINHDTRARGNTKRRAFLWDFSILVGNILNEDL